MVSDVHFWDNMNKKDKIEKISFFLEDFLEIDHLVEYFEDFNKNLSKKNLNSFLKGVIKP
jgi:cytochrome b pre-mRNA-processing protein 3